MDIVVQRSNIQLANILCTQDTDGPYKH